MLAVIASCQASFTATGVPAAQRLASQNKKPRTMPGLFLLTLRNDQYRATSGPLNL